MKVSSAFDFDGGPKRWRAGCFKWGVRIFSLLVDTWVWSCRVGVPFCTYSLTSHLADVASSNLNYISHHFGLIGHILILILKMKKIIYLM